MVEPQRGSSRLTTPFLVPCRAEEAPQWWKWNPIMTCVSCTITSQEPMRWNVILPYDGRKVVLVRPSQQIVLLYYIVGSCTITIGHVDAARTSSRIGIPWQLT